MKSKIVPTSLVWILIHTILFLIGIIIFDVPEISNLLGAPLAEALGGGIAATGAAGIFIYLYVRQSDSLSETIQLISESGLAKAFDSRAARIKSEYDVRLTKFDSLDVLGFGLSNFREDYKGEFNRWATRSKVRILLIDPHFPSTSHSLAKLRDKEEKTQVGKIKSDVEMFISELKHTVGQNPNFEVRLLRCTPTLNIFRVDDEIFFGPYLMHRASRNSFTMLCRRGGFLFSSLREHFEAIWTSDDFSTPLT